MTRAKLLERLRELKDCGASEDAHIEADKALLEFINDQSVTDAFKEIERWYA